MLNAGFQYLEQRDANDTITKDGVVGKNSPFATSDNSGIYDIIAEDLRWLKENVDDVKDTSDLEAIKQSVTDMYNTMKNDSSFGEAAAKAQAEEAKKQAQAALESATNAKTYHDEVMAKSTEINDTIAEIKAYIEKAEKLIESNKELEQTLGNYVTVASNKAQAASDSATNAATSESNAATSAEHAATSETNAKTSETNAANSAAKAKESETNLETAVSNAATSATNAKASETNAKSSETNSKASEVSAKTYETNASNSANLAKAWAESNESPDSMNDTDSTTGKTQSSKSWALYSRDRAISAYNSEANASASESKAKASETNAKISETNAATSAEHAATSEVNASTSESHAATSEANAKTSETNARSSETNSKASEANARTSETNASNSADLSKKWAESSDSPDSVNDTDSTTGKTQSSKSWALYARDRAISAYSSESNAKASETASKTSETNAKTSETNAAKSASNAKTSESAARTSETNAKASETAAKTSEDNASTSKSNAAASESNAKSYMDTAKEYMQKAQEALAAAQAIQSIVDTAKANAEKCLADVEAVKESLAKMITYQGSVDNYSDLPTNPQVGYSYNVKNADKEHGVNAGDNLVWNGTDWDNFGGAIDMNLFAELGKDVNFNTVTATSFTGDLDGIAAKATNDKNGADIAATYLKKAGGTATGKITFNSTDLNALPEVKKTSDDNMSGVRFSSKSKFLGAVGKRLSNGEDLLNLRSNNTTIDVVLDSRNYGSYALPKSGGTMSGALNFANITWNTVGDDSYMGDHNISGTFCVKGANGETGIALCNKANDADYARISYGGGNINFNKTIGGNISGNAATATNSAAANKVNNSGNKTAIKDGTREPDGLHLYQCYDNGYPTTYGNVISIGGAGGGELLAGWSGADKGIEHLYYRNRRGAGALWSDWRTVAFTSDINSYAPTKTGTGASGTWPISISGNAAGLSGSLSFPDIGNVATSNKISWSGSTDGADIYYQTTASDQGNLVLNLRDDANCYLRIAYNGAFKSYFTPADGNFHGNVNGTADTALNIPTSDVGGNIWIR